MHERKVEHRRHVAGLHGIAVRRPRVDRRPQQLQHQPAVRSRDARLFLAQPGLTPRAKADSYPSCVMRSSI